MQLQPPTSSITYNENQSVWDDIKDSLIKVSTTLSLSILKTFFVTPCRKKNDLLCLNYFLPMAQQPFQFTIYFVASLIEVFIMWELGTLLTC